MAAGNESIGGRVFQALNYAPPVKYLTIDPGEQRVVRTADKGIWAEIAPFSVAEAADRAKLEQVWPADRAVARWIVPAGHPEPQDVEDPIEHAFASWSGTGRALLDRGLRVLVEVCRERRSDLLVWPRAKSIVSDIPGLLSVSRTHDQVGIFLEPQALMPGVERAQRLDFVTRLMEVVPLACVRAVCFGGGASREQELRDYAPLAGLAAELNKPVVLLGDPQAEAAAALGLA